MVCTTLMTCPLTMKHLHSLNITRVLTYSCDIHFCHGTVVLAFNWSHVQSAFCIRHSCDATPPVPHTASSERIMDSLHSLWLHFSTVPEEISHQGSKQLFLDTAICAPLWSCRGSQLCSICVPPFVGMGRAARTSWLASVLTTSDHNFSNCLHGGCMHSLHN